MTEEEARKALFQVHYEYMKNPPQKRLELYDEYQAKRKQIKHELAKLILERKQAESKIK